MPVTFIGYLHATAFLPQGFCTSICPQDDPAALDSETVEFFTGSDHHDGADGAAATLLPFV